VLSNLVSNAVKYTERGEVVVHVRPGAGASTVRFSVRDTGHRRHAGAAGAACSSRSSRPTRRRPGATAAPASA
jgi:anti-sigma regulatory factor (Ser/Thr protein kinase)